jgi:phasin family protein
MSSPINPFQDLQAMMSQFSIQGLDLASVVESRRKDIDALVAANRAALETAQTLAQKQTEMLMQAMQDIQQAVRDAATGDPAKSTAAARAAVEKAIEDMKELAQIAQDAQKDALAALTKRAGEQLEEIRGMTKAKPASKK